MPEPRYLARAPIKEAIIDFQVKPPASLTSGKRLDAKHGDFFEDYPTKRAIVQGRFGLQVKEDEPVSTSFEHDIFGYRFESDSGNRIVQFRTNGFTFSILEPYKSWDELITEARRMWGHYIKVASPELIVRVATRFINVMSIPLPITDFRDYLVTSPEVPGGLPQGVTSFMTRVVVPDPDSKATVILTQALEGIENQAVPIVLDIDAFTQSSFDIDEPDCWEYLERLRELKNKFFFHSVTEKALELFA